MQVNLCWWEWQQLEEHILDRPDIWECGGGLYSRSVDDVPVVGLAVAIPPSFSKYTQVPVTVVGLGWDEERANTYVLSLLTKWTSYGHRLKISALLGEELKLASNIANLMAIALEYINHVDDGGQDPEPGADVSGGGSFIQPLDTTVAIPIVTDQLVRGGYVSLALVNGRIRARVSIRTHPRYGGGFGGVLEGTLRTTDGQDLLRAALLAGWETPPVPVQDEAQLGVPSASAESETPEEV